MAYGSSGRLPGVQFCQQPWIELFFSMPVWAIIVANFAHSWSFYLFIISQPKYFKDAFTFEMTAVRALCPFLLHSLF